MQITIYERASTWTWNALLRDVCVCVPSQTPFSLFSPVTLWLKQGVVQPPMHPALVGETQALD